jgi:mono/diheme cytochrome c family protein
MTRRIAGACLVLLACIGGAVCVLGIWFVGKGVSARPQPSALETTIARKLRTAAIPHDARIRPNPVSPTTDALRAGLQHFADHCAVCHANDGSGDTPMGRGLYPRAPDMRDPATQTLSDGELFYIIENGVRLTGMPAWSTGTPEGERESWQLVHTVRKLPALAEGELEQMKEWNRKTEAEWRSEEAERKFLAGEDGVPSPASAHKHGGGRR